MEPYLLPLVRYVPELAAVVIFVFLLFRHLRSLIEILDRRLSEITEKIAGTHEAFVLHISKYSDHVTESQKEHGLMMEALRNILEILRRGQAK